MSKELIQYLGRVACNSPFYPEILAVIKEVRRLRDDNKKMRYVLFEAREIDRILESPYVGSIQGGSPCHKLLKRALKSAEDINYDD